MIDKSFSEANQEKETDKGVKVAAAKVEKTKARVGTLETGKAAKQERQDAGLKEETAVAKLARGGKKKREETVEVERGGVVAVGRAEKKGEGVTSNAVKRSEVEADTSISKRSKHKHWRRDGDGAGDRRLRRIGGGG